jgi:glucose/arabinose dehydrogenase
MRRLITFLLSACAALTLHGAAPAQAPQAAQPHALATLAAGLEHPWSLAFLPDGRMLVTERPGRLLLIQPGRAPVRVAGTPPVFARKQSGLLEVSLHPRFAQNRLVYLSYVHGTPQANALRLARARLDGDRLTDLRVIFQGPSKGTPVNAGGRLVWLPDETLVLSVGDGWDYREQAQRPGALLGKLVRLTDDGAVPPDNPFVGHAGAKPQIWSLGHRHAQGLAYDPVNRRLYAHEHGPRGGDEINVIQRAGNYGWPVATYGRDYSGAVITPFQHRPGLIDPVLHWTPSIAPSGLAVYRGALFPQWRGDLLVTTLAGRHLRRVDLDGAGRVVGQEVLLADLNVRLRDVRVGPEGAVYLLTDEPKGRLLRLTPGADRPRVLARAPDRR